MMGSMKGARPRLRTVGATIAALLIILVALAPTLLLGEAPSAISLIVTGGILLALGLLLRWAGGANARTPGTIVIIVGVVLLALGVGLLVLALAGP
jgi:hypothetical protein